MSCRRRQRPQKDCHLDSSFLIRAALFFPRLNLYEKKKCKLLHNEHPDKNVELVVQFGVNLESACMAYEILLRTIDMLGLLRDENTVKHAVEQYKRFMRLKLLHPNETLIPTLDIEMVWASHLIRPAKYIDDCKAMRLNEGVVPRGGYEKGMKDSEWMVEHWLVLSEEEALWKDNALERTCQLWKREYGQDYLDSNKLEIELRDVLRYKYDKLQKDLVTSFDTACMWKAEIDEIRNGNPGRHGIREDLAVCYVNQLSNREEPPEQPKPTEIHLTWTDVVKDGDWLNELDECMKGLIILWQVRSSSFLSIFRDHVFSYHAVLPKSYERFLFLWSKQMHSHDLVDRTTREYDPRTMAIVPPASIDLVWHAHMMHPKVYESDCERLVGAVLHHEPWPLDHGMSKDQVSELERRAELLWKQEFGVNLQDEHQLI
jgi:hypothetical protein